MSKETLKRISLREETVVKLETTDKMAAVARDGERWSTTVSAMWY